jgi:hypothetical protein
VLSCMRLHMIDVSVVHMNATAPKTTMLLFGLLLSTGFFEGCGGGCPGSRSAADRESWAVDLRKKELLRLHPEAPIAIKRDVHDFVVGAEAEVFAGAFHQVMMDPERRFGLIKVDRLPENARQPFHEKEHFQGRYELVAGGKEKLRGIWKHIFGPLLDDAEVNEALCKLENGHTSDFGEIAELNLIGGKSGRFSMRYEYLTGSPIAGSSTFEVEAISGAGTAASRTRVRQVFVYQEQTESFAGFFSKGGLKLHDQVVYSQVRQAAEKAGTCILETDIPREYAGEL